MTTVGKDFTVALAGVKTLQGHFRNATFA